MSQSTLVTRVIGNLAALTGIVLLVGLGIDHAAGRLGYRPMAFCTLLSPVLVSAYSIGVVLTCIGTIMVVVSLGRNASGLGLAIGGILLFALPLVLPRYLGMACLL